MGLGICWLHLADLPPSKVFIHYSISNVVGPHIKVLATNQTKMQKRWSFVTDSSFESSFRIYGIHFLHWWQNMWKIFLIPLCSQRRWFRISHVAFYVYFSSLLSLRKYVWYLIVMNNSGGHFFFSFLNFWTRLTF